MTKTKTVPNDELLPCPFCGGRAMIRQGKMTSGCQLHGEKSETWIVECKHQDAKWKDSSNLPRCDIKPQAHGFSKKDAIKAWNARKEAAPPVEDDHIHQAVKMVQPDNAEALDWPPMKKALWDVLMEEKLNDGHYIKAFDLVEKLYRAALTQKQEWRDVIDPSTDKPVCFLSAEDAVYAYANAHDSDGCEFNGDEYDIKLLTHFAEYLQWRGLLPQPPQAMKGDDDVQ